MIQETTIMFSDQDNTSDSLDVTVTDVPESLLDYVISNFVKSLNEAKTAKKISAKIHHVEGQSPNLVLTLGGQSGKRI